MDTHTVRVITETVAWFLRNGVTAHTLSVRLVSMGVHDDEIKQRIKAAREAKGMSQADLAGYMDARGYEFKQQTINKIEKGDRKVSAAELVALAGSLGVSAANLLGQGEDRTPLLMAGARLEEAMRHLDSSSIAYARAMLSYTQAADGVEQIHASDEEFIRESLFRQTPGWIATAHALDSLEATLKLNRVKLQGEFSTGLLQAMRDENNLLHGEGNG